MTLLAGRPSAPPPRSAAAPTRSTFVPSRPLGKSAPPPAAIAAKIGSKGVAPSPPSRLAQAIASQARPASRRLPMQQAPNLPTSKLGWQTMRGLNEMLGGLNLDLYGTMSPGLSDLLPVGPQGGFVNRMPNGPDRMPPPVLNTRWGYRPEPLGLAGRLSARSGRPRVAKTPAPRILQPERFDGHGRNGFAFV